MSTWAAVVAGAALMLAGSPAAQDVDTFKVPTFGQVVVYRPASGPTQVVLFISGDGGWNLGVVPMAERLRDLGALVVGLDVRTFLKSLGSSKGCAYPAGVLEELSRAIQLRYKLPAYERPILVGYSSGATLAYAAVAAAPPESFAGAVSLGFCPDLELGTPLCQMRGLKATRRSKGIGYDLAPFAALRTPWMVLQGDVDQVCAPAATRSFVAATGSARVFSLPNVGHGFAVPRNWEHQFVEAYRAVANAASRRDEPRISVPEVQDLPLVEVPAAAMADRREMAIMLSGDGGWAELDKGVAAGLAARGIPTVGLSSLQYFWTPRTPEATAADLARVISHYTLSWRAERVILLGYSFGADVLPFLVNRLPPDARAKVAKVVLLGPDTTAAFEFHVAEWLGRSAGHELPTVPEVNRLGVPVTCVQGADDADSACGQIRNPQARTVTIGAGHHFSGEYSRVVEAALQPR